MSSINIKRAVENIRSGTNVYTPVIELIVNAIQAIRVIRATGGTITITVLRSSQMDLVEKLAAVDGFIVEDDGVGFNKDNRDAFDTLYTASKAAYGGKGFGRFTCLKYFHQLKVESVFEEDSTFRKRSFSMGNEKEIIVNEEISTTDKTSTGSLVTINGVRSIKFPDKGIDTIAKVIVEKLLPYFIDPHSKCPVIMIKDNSGGAPRKLNDYLTADDRQIIELPTGDSKLQFTAQDICENFDVRIFKFYAPRSNKSKISLVAHQREVTDTSLQAYIPEFSDEFYERGDQELNGRDKNYIIKAYVFGDYLDRNVSLERGGFNFQREDDLLYGISQAQIEKGAAKVAQDAIGVEILARKERKNARIREYIDEHAPWHRALSKEADFSSLPMNPTPEEIELHLQASKFQQEKQARAEVKAILSNDDPRAIKGKAAKLVKKISQTNKNDLIHYVSLRKCVLDLFSKSLEIDEKTGRYKSEGDVHDIIMPRKSDTDGIDYEEHNLWILDERLNFSTYVASDIAFNRGRSDRGDVTIFDKRVAFRGDNEPSNPITIFEFKRPGRDDFANQSSDDDPVEQVIRYVNEIRDGKYKMPNGREIRVTDNTPFYGYVVCELTKKVEKWLRREKNFTEMPDNLGWFDWIGNIKLYIEVLSWTKVSDDAKMRNRIFFHKLGI